jgi:hypothetical protein
MTMAMSRRFVGAFRENLGDVAREVDVVLCRPTQRCVPSRKPKDWADQV